MAFWNFWKKNTDLSDNAQQAMADGRVTQEEARLMTEEDIKILEEEATVRGKKARRWHGIFLGIAAVMLGMTLVSVFAFGGPAAIGAAYYALSTTFTTAAFGALCGAGVCKFFNRKNRANLKILNAEKQAREQARGGKSYETAATKFAKHFKSGRKYVNNDVRNILEGTRYDDGLTNEAPKASGSASSNNGPEMTNNR